MPLNLCFGLFELCSLKRVSKQKKTRFRKLSILKYALSYNSRHRNLNVYADQVYYVIWIFTCICIWRQFILPTTYYSITKHDLWPETKKKKKYLYTYRADLLTLINDTILHCHSIAYCYRPTMCNITFD